MAQIALSVLGFTQYCLDEAEQMTSDTEHITSIGSADEEDEDIAAIVLQETGGSRYIVIRLGEPEISILYRIVYEPGEPLLAHETAVKVFKRVGVTVDSARITREDSENRTINFRVIFRHGNHVWEEYMLAFDVLGYAIASGASILIEEDLLDVLSKKVLPLERLGLTSEGATSLSEVTVLAKHLPKDKLTGN